MWFNPGELFPLPLQSIQLVRKRGIQHPRAPVTCGTRPETDSPHKTRRRNTNNLQRLRNELLGQIQQGLLPRLPNG